MRKSAPIEVVVHYPKTEEGWEELGKRVATAYAKEILNSIGASQSVTDRDRAQIALSYH